MKKLTKCSSYIKSGKSGAYMSAKNENKQEIKTTTIEYDEVCKLSSIMTHFDKDLVDMQLNIQYN